MISGEHWRAGRPIPGPCAGPGSNELSTFDSWLYRSKVRPMESTGLLVDDEGLSGEPWGKLVVGD